MPSTVKNPLSSATTYLSACAAMSGMPRPPALPSPRQLLSKNTRSSQVVADNALVQAIKLAVEALHEDGNLIILIRRTREKVREAAPREARRDLGAARRAAHCSDEGTCETKAMW